MIGIYKITNKLNGKSYIGQSIHCGKRLDQHCKGDQLIDNVIQIEGIENFSFEIVKQCEKEELSSWEDYYIEEYGTMIPNGYNKKWNCSREEREEFRRRIDKSKENILIYKGEKSNECKAKSAAPNQRTTSVVGITDDEIVEFDMKVYWYLYKNGNWDPQLKEYFIPNDLVVINKIQRELCMGQPKIERTLQRMEETGTLIYKKEENKNLSWKERYKRRSRSCVFFDYVLRNSRKIKKNKKTIFDELIKWRITELWDIDEKALKLYFLLLNSVDFSSNSKNFEFFDTFSLQNLLKMSDSIESRNKITALLKQLQEKDLINFEKIKDKSKDRFGLIPYYRIYSVENFGLH